MSHRWRVSALAVTIVLALTPTAAQSTDASVRAVSPTSVRVGETIRIEGSGCPAPPAGQTVNVEFSDGVIHVSFALNPGGISYRASDLWNLPFWTRTISDARDQPLGARTITARCYNFGPDAPKTYSADLGSISAEYTAYQYQTAPDAPPARGSSFTLAPLDPCPGDGWLGADVTVYAWSATNAWVVHDGTVPVTASGEWSLSVPVGHDVTSLRAEAYCFAAGAPHENRYTYQVWDWNHSDDGGNDGGGGGGDDGVVPEKCRMPLFIGVRGSGETKSHYGGYGQTVLEALNGFKATYGGDVDAVAVDYDALPVKTLFSEGPDVYFAGVEDGIDTLQMLIRTRSVDCPNQKLVLVGYSQGALAVNQFLYRNNGSPTLDRVAAVALIADPHRMGGGAYTLGTAPADLDGVTYTLGSSWDPYPSVDIAAQVRHITDSVCNEDDLVCAFDTRFQFGRSNGRWQSQAARAHGSYKGGRNSWAYALGTRAARRTLASG